MTDSPTHEKIDWDELHEISKAARSTGLAIFYNDFSAPQAQHNSRGVEGNHSFGLVLTVAEEDAIRRARETASDKTVDLLEHPRTCWASTPKLAILASLVMLEARPKH